MSLLSDQPQEPQPQANRVRIAPTPLQPSMDTSTATGVTNAPFPSATTYSATLQQRAYAKPSCGPIAAALAQAPAAALESSGTQSAYVACKPAATGHATSLKPDIVAASRFVVDAHDAVFFRAVFSQHTAALAAEIASGGQPVSVEFLHQHFGDSEQIRGYSGLAITLWIHVKTYHVWVDIRYAAKRPGADKLSSVFEGAFPAGYCRSQEEFLSTVSAAVATMPDLMTLGDDIGSVPLVGTVYGTLQHCKPGIGTGSSADAASRNTSRKKGPGSQGGVALEESGRAQQVASGNAAPDADSGSSEGGGGVPVVVSVRRFQLSTAPPEVKALHARLEPLLLFTIDGANFIDADDPQWELLLPVARAADGGCIVLGLTTLFSFYAHPASCRLRVSQVLVLSPWQGLGLGKALLKLSYDLARLRNCADLTVEDPTPNLQRVREKLEVEMMRGLGWVVAQANECLKAVSRGETTWPAWDPPAALRTAPCASVSESATTGYSGARPATAPASDAAEQAQQGRTHCEPQQCRGGGHSLLASHGYFAALGAVPPELMLPGSVLSEATAAAEARGYGQLRELKRPTVAKVTVLPGLPFVALAPSAAFVSAVTQKLKIHRGQVRVVWEALLWCTPGALQRPGIRAALEGLMERRLESQHFSSVGRVAATKRLVDTARMTASAAKAAGADANQEKSAAVTDFFMYRPVGPSVACVPDNGGSSAAADPGAIATGRLNFTQVTLEDKASRVEELLQERWQQLESLALVLTWKGKQAYAGIAHASAVGAKRKAAVMSADIAVMV